jgi:hypothetical protein
VSTTGAVCGEGGDCQCVRLSWNVTDFLGDSAPATLREDFVGDMKLDDVEGRFDWTEGSNSCLEAESCDSEATGLSVGRIGD